MKTTERQVTQKIQNKINTTIRSIALKEKLTIKNREKERLELLTNLLAPSREFKAFTDQITKNYQSLFSKVKVKDCLFDFFFARGERVGRYLILPLITCDFRTGKKIEVFKEMDESTREHSLVLAWDIFTAKISLMYMFFYHGGRPYQESASNDNNFHISLSQSFFSKEEMKDLRSRTLEGLKKYDVDDDQKKQMEFLHLCVELIPDQSEKFLEYITDKHIEDLAREGKSGFLFSRRTRKPLQFEEGSYIKGPEKNARDNIRNMADSLLEGFYPDIQKVWVKVEKGTEDIADRLVTARTIRKWFHKDFYLKFSSELHQHIYKADNPWYEPFTKWDG